MECLVLPLQDKLEEWRKTAVNLDKEHAKGSTRPFRFRRRVSLGQRRRPATLSRASVTVHLARVSEQIARFVNIQAGRIGRPVNHGERVVNLSNFQPSAKMEKMETIEKMEKIHFSFLFVGEC